MSTMCDTQDSAIARLKGLFLNPDPDWVETWRSLLDADHIRQEIATSTRTLLVARRAPREWQDDVEQEAMLVLARRLRSKPDLGVDPDQIDETFCAWIGTIVANACFHAFRRIRRLHRESGLPLDFDMLDPEDLDLLEQWADVSQAMEKLDPVTRLMLRLFAEGRKPPAVAEALDLPYVTTYRQMRQGICELRKLLEDDP